MGKGKSIFHLTSYYVLQEKQQYALTLVTVAEGLVGASESSPASDVFRTLLSTFKSNVDDFMVRAEQRHKELNTLVHVHRFCDQVCVLSSFIHLTFQMKLSFFFTCRLPTNFKIPFFFVSF